MSNTMSSPNGENPYEIYDLDSGLKLLREYSGIPEEDVKDHVELIVSLASALSNL